MTKFKRIKIKNFLSYGKNPTVVELDNNDISLIIGENRDVGSEGYSRNGVGKSTIFQALFYVLYDDGIENIKKNDFINLTNKKNMEVTLEFEVNGSDFVLTRGRKPNKIELTRNGEPFTLHNADSVDDTIVKLIGMDSDVFLNSNLLTTNTEAFMKMKPAPQKKFMENILSMDLLSERADFLKAKNKEVAEDIKIEQTKKEISDQQIRDTESKIGTLKEKVSNWDKDNSNKISEAQEAISLISSIDVEREINIIEQNEKAKNEVNSIQSELNELSSQEQTEINDALHEKNREIYQVEKELSQKKEDASSRYRETILSIEERKEGERASLDDLKQTYAELESSINDLQKDSQKITSEINTHESHIKSMDQGVCPFCEQDYADHDRVEEIHSEIAKLNEHNKKINNELNPLIKQEEELKPTIEEKEAQFNDKFKKLQEEAESKLDEDIKTASEECASKVELINLGFEQDRDSIEAKYKKKKELFEKELDEAQQKIHSTDFTRDELVQVQHELKTLNAEIERLENETNPYIEQVALLENDLVPYDTSHLEDLEKRQRHYKMLVKMLTDSKSFVRRYIIDQYVPFLNTKINGYLGELESPHKLEINSDLSVDIHYMGNTISYGNLSNGERLRINLSVNLAFRELLEVSGRNTNILMIDELLDSGADPNFFLRAFRLFEQQKEKASVFVISHRDELITKADQIMKIVKKNGFSKVEYEEGA